RLQLQGWSNFCGCFRLQKRDACDLVSEIRDGKRGEIFQSNAFCAANARDFCNRDPERKNCHVAIGYRVADFCKRLEVERAVSSGQRVRQKTPELRWRVLANRDGWEMPHPRDERRDVVGSGLVFYFPLWRRQKKG